MKLTELDAGEQLIYDVLAYDEPMANIKAIEQAQIEVHKSISLHGKQHDNI